MKIGKKVSESIIFRNFILTELLDYPTNKLQEHNLSKKSILDIFKKKGKRLRNLFDKIRPKMYDISFTKIKEWREAEINKKELRNLRVINTPGWRAFFYNNKLGTIGGLATKIKYNKVKKNKRISKIISISKNIKELNKTLNGEKRIVILKKPKDYYSVLEGNHRAVALILSGIKLKRLPVYLGIEKNLKSS